MPTTASDELLLGARMQRAPLDLAHRKRLAKGLVSEREECQVPTAGAAAMAAKAGGVIAGVGASAIRRSLSCWGDAGGLAARRLLMAVSKGLILASRAQATSE
jgi:hypothetical protein